MNFFGAAQQKYEAISSRSAEDEGFPPLAESILRNLCEMFDMPEYLEKHVVTNSIQNINEPDTYCVTVDSTLVGPPGDGEVYVAYSYYGDSYVIVDFDFEWT